MPEGHAPCHSSTPWLPASALPVIALLIPLAAMAVLPFHDTSEPRYAEIARVMAETGDWITPWFAPGVPFWGKPPLSFWAQALAIKGLGLSEFALRLPSWLCWLATHAVLWASVRRIHGAHVAHWTVVVYATCTLGSLCAGAVITDPFLALGTTLSLTALAVTLHDATTINPLSRLPSLLWRYGFFVGLSIGLLAKGPLAVVLCLAPALVWAAVRRWQHHPTHLHRLPWWRGLLLCTLVSLPWYLLAEFKTPGFLHYFILGEHFLRFVDSGWAGDLYGTAHRETPGTIWLFWLLAAFPWSVAGLLVLLAALCRPRLRRTLYTRLRPLWQHPLWPLWLAAALTAPAFFTLAANVLWTYNLPALAGFSVLVALGLHAWGLDACAAQRPKWLRPAWAVAAIVPVVVLGLSLSLITGVHTHLGKTERELVRFAQNTEALPLFYLEAPPFSARFYTRGRVQSLSEAALHARLQVPQPFWVAVPHQRYAALEAQIGTLTVSYRNRRYTLLRLPQAAPESAPELAAEERFALNNP